MKERKFIKLPPEKAPQMFDLVLERMKWMDEKGIEQWNVMGYDEVYPLSYYEQKCSEGRAFALENKDGAILCAAVLLEHDSRLSDDAPAIYVHNLVSKVGAGDVGAEFLRRAGEYALSINKKYLRLDSSEITNRSQSITKTWASFLPEPAPTDRITAFAARRS